MSRTEVDRDTDRLRNRVREHTTVSYLLGQLAPRVPRHVPYTQGMRYVLTGMAYRVATVRPGAARPRIRPDRDLSQSAYAARCCLRTPPPVARRPSATNSQWRRRWASIKSSDVAGAGAAAQSHARRASTIVGTCEHTRLEWRRISKASHQAMPLACASAPESPCQKHV